MRAWLELGWVDCREGGSLRVEALGWIIRQGKDGDVMTMTKMMTTMMMITTIIGVKITSNLASFSLHLSSSHFSSPT